MIGKAGWCGAMQVVDLSALSEGLALFKTGMEGLRSAFQFAKEIKGSLPDDKADEVGKALERSEQQFAHAEAQIAKGLGYELCHCHVPPTPMLTVGWKTRPPTGPVHRCPKCGITDNAGMGWSPTEVIAARADATLSPKQP